VRSEKVLGHEHPDTLGSMNNLASVLGRQGKYKEAEAMNRLTPTTRACRQHHADALASQEQDQLTISPTIADSNASTRAGKGSKLPRRLAKIGIRSSKLSAR
jgi:hypothetical protein